MSEQPMNLSEFERLSKLEFAAHSVILDMMPVEMVEFVEKGPAAMQWAVQQIHGRLEVQSIVEKELKLLKAALDKYAVQAANPMFKRDLQICIAQLQKCP